MRNVLLTGLGLSLFLAVFYAGPAPRSRAAEAASAPRVLLSAQAAVGQVQGDPRGRVDPAKFGFGLEYLVPGMAKQYADIAGVGVNWIKVSLVSWGRFEPNPPIAGKHTYHWADADRAVAEYQAAGFTNMIVILKSISPWGTAPTKSAVTREFDPGRATPPRPENWDDYAAWVQNLVERYDGDGIDDMPNLKAPLLHYEIESEAQHPGYWQGTLADYGRLLKTAYQAAKRANPDCKIILSGIALSDTFDDLPSPAVIEQRTARLTPFARRALEFVLGSLRFQDSYDMVEFHYNYDPQGIYGITSFLRAEMRKAGTVKPIWAGDAASAPMFDSNFVPMYPRDQVADIAAALGDVRHPRHAQIERDYQAAQARNVVKKVVLSLDVGLAGIMIGNLQDWPGFNIQNKSWIWQGLSNPDGTHRPAYSAYKLLREKLGKIQKFSRIDFGRGVYAYEVDRESGKLYILWAAKGDVEVRLPVAFDRAQITVAVTSDPASGAQVFQAKPTQGELLLRLTTIPIYVERR
jgi:hypothetical protein